MNVLLKNSHSCCRRTTATDVPTTKVSATLAPRVTCHELLPTTFAMLLHASWIIDLDKYSESFILHTKQATVHMWRLLVVALLMFLMLSTTTHPSFTSSVTSAAAAATTSHHKWELPSYPKLIATMGIFTDVIDTTTTMTTAAMTTMINTTMIDKMICRMTLITRMTTR